MQTPSKEQWTRVDQLIDELEECQPQEIRERLNALEAQGEAPLVIKYLRTHFRLPKDPWLQPGETLVDRYTILSRLGEGGMGVVYKAVQRAPYRNVALKVIHPSFAISRRFAESFTKEINNLGRVSHSGIVQIYEADKQIDERGQRTTPFYTMELVDGEPIDRYCRAQKLELLGILELVISVCEAVQHAHDRGLIHGDLKPPNILVRRESGHPVILDFGLSRITTELLRQDEETRKEAASHLDSRPIGGTPGYMSPEQVNGSLGKMGLGYGIDVYALGVILYELLSGSQPIRFPENATFDELSRQILTVMPRPLNTVSERCDEELSYIVGKAIRKEANRRYLSVADLQRALELYRDRVFGRRARAGRWIPHDGARVPATQWRLERQIWPPVNDSSASWRMESLWLARREDAEEGNRVLRFFSEELVARAIKRDSSSLRMLEGGFDPLTPIQIVDGASLDVEPFFTVERPVEGLPLAIWLQRYDADLAVPELAKLFIVEQIARGLSAAHRRGVIHGALSADCVFILGDPFDTDGALRVTVVGFAFRRLVSKFEADYRPTLAPGSIGWNNERAFEAPEIAEGLEPRMASDIYSLGVLYYKLIVGDLAATPPRQLAAYPVDPLIAADIESCLAPHPEDRISSAAELAARVESLTERREGTWRENEERARLRRRSFQRGFAWAAVFAMGVVSLIAHFAIQATIKKNEALFEEARGLQLSSRAGRRLKSIEALDKVGALGVQDKELLSAYIDSYNLIDIRKQVLALPPTWQEETIALGVFGPGMQRLVLGADSGRVTVMDRGGQVLFDVSGTRPGVPVFAALSSAVDGNPLLAVTRTHDGGHTIAIYDLSEHALLYFKAFTEKAPPPIAFGGPYTELDPSTRYFGYVDPSDGDLRLVNLSTLSEERFRRRGASTPPPYLALDLISPAAPKPEELLLHPSQPMAVARYDAWTVFAHAWDLRPDWPDNRNAWLGFDWVQSFPAWATLRELARGAGVMGRQLRPVRRSLRLYHRTPPQSLAWTLASDGLEVYTEGGERVEWDLAAGFESGRRGALAAQMADAYTENELGSLTRLPFPAIDRWVPAAFSYFFADQYPFPKPRKVMTPLNPAPNLLAASRDEGAVVAVDTQGLVHVTDERYGQSVDVEIGSGEITRVRFSPGGVIIAADTKGMAPMLFAYELGSERVAMDSSGDGLPVTSMAFLGQDQILAVARGGVITLFDAEFGRELLRIDDLMTQSLFATQDGGLVSGGAAGAFAWTVERTPNADVFKLKGEETLELPHHLGTLAAARSQRVVIASHYDHLHGAFYGNAPDPVADDLDPARIEWTSPNGAPIDRVRLSASGRWFATSSQASGQVLISAWNRAFAETPLDESAGTQTAREAFRVSDQVVVPGNADSFEFSPVSETLVTVVDGRLRAWEPGSWRSLRRVERADAPGTGVMAFSSDERLLAALVRGDRIGVVLYDWATMRPLARLPVDSGSAVSELSIGSQSRRLAIGFENGEVIVWDLALLDDRVKTQISPVNYSELPLDLSEIQVELGGLSRIDRVRSQRQGLVEVLSEELRRAPDMTAQRNNLAVNQAYVGSVGLAITNMLESIEGPGGFGNANRWENLAMMYWRIGDKDNARIAAVNAVEVQPEDPRATLRRFEFLAFLLSMAETEPPVSASTYAGDAGEEVSQRIRGPQRRGSQTSPRALVVGRFESALSGHLQGDQPVPDELVADAEALAIAKTLAGEIEEALRIFGKFPAEYRSVSGWSAYWIADSMTAPIAQRDLSMEHVVSTWIEAGIRDGYTMDFRQKLFELLKVTVSWDPARAEEAWAVAMGVLGVSDQRMLKLFESSGPALTVEGVLTRALLEARAVSRSVARARIRAASDSARAWALTRYGDDVVVGRLLEALSEALGWTESERRRWRSAFLERTSSSGLGQ